MVKLVYCAHSSKTMDRSKNIVLFVLKKGYIPIDPFLTIPPEIYDELGYDEDKCVDTDIYLLAKCDEIWVFLFDSKVTYGVSKEIDWWKKNRKEDIKYFKGII